MNYLAHAFLSFEEEELLFGNFIGDFVKGSHQGTFSDEIWRGVMLHRAIDSFTDAHEATEEAKGLIRHDLGLTSGIFVDMIFDHVLAKNWKEYSDQSLEEFTLSTYAKLDKFKAEYPEGFGHMYAYMKRDNWLLLYQEEQMMQRFLGGVSRRLKVENNLNESFKHYQEFNQELDALFDPLFQDLIDLSTNY